MLDRLRRVVGEALHLGGRESELNADTPLLGNLPELDSMAVLTVISTLEEHFHFVVADDDDIAQAFETMGSLINYVEEKTRA
jgi:acyl carrier protein